MVKLPIHVDVQHWSDWQACLMASVQRLNGLQAEAQTLQAETARYIRPMLLVQVERTGADTRDAGYIHAQDVLAYLLQIGFTARQIAVKTAEKNDLKAPENIDLLSPLCEVRVIITKQALQEGWDCPFAYVLCALAAGRNPAATTQLVGRILRQPQVTKTDREALDACYVLCHDTRTSEVVKAIKASLEGEGPGNRRCAGPGLGGAGFAGLGSQCLVGVGLGRHGAAAAAGGRLRRSRAGGVECGQDPVRLAGLEAAEGLSRLRVRAGPARWCAAQRAAGDQRRAPGRVG